MSGRGQPRRGGTALRRFLLAGFILLLFGVAIGVARFDFGSKLEELTLPLAHQKIIRQQAEEKGVPADLIAAVIYEESRFRDQTSSAGARGLMQITPATADTIETLSGGETFVYEDLADPELNIRYGTYYLSHLLEKYDGDIFAVLAAYNAGEGNADRWGGAELRLDDISFPETRSYVEQVLETRDRYREKYGRELGLHPER